MARAEATRLLLRAAAARRAWWAASSSAPSAVAAPTAAAAAAATALLGVGGVGSGGVGAPSSSWSSSWSSSFASSAEAIARARRLAAAQARRQQQHERAAARLARAPVGNGSNSDATADAALAPTAPRSPPPATAIDPGSLSPSAALAAARAVAHPALVVTRAIEWGTVVLGFEQANKYTVYDQDGRVACLIAEDEAGLGNAVGRQLLRTRRAFTATVLSPEDGRVLFRVRRPAYLVSSTTYVETAEGDPVGEVRQRWHPLRRNFDLYVDRQQYARISGPLLAWEFQVDDGQGKTLALIDRNFQGFAKELFTDAGKYVVHFGMPPEESALVATRTLEARSGRADFGAVAPLRISGGGGSEGAAGASSAAAAAPAASTPTTTETTTDAVAVIPQTTGGQLAVARPLALDERMVALAAAVAIDFAFFSQHSHTSGMFAPPLLFPMPFPGGGGGGAAEEAGGGEGGAGGGGGGEGAAAGGLGGGGGAAGGAAGGGAAPGAGAGEGGAAGGGDEGWSWDDDKGGGGGEEGGGDSGWSPWGGGDGDDDGGGGGDDGEGGGTVGSVVRGLWRVFGDDD